MNVKAGNSRHGNIGFRFWDSIKVCSCTSRIRFHKKQKLSSYFHEFLFPVLLLLFFIWRICKNDWKSFSYDPRGTYFQSKNMRDSKRSRQLLNCSKYLPVACVGCKAILFQRRTLNIIIIIAFNPRNTEIKTGKPMWYHINAWAN